MARYLLLFLLFTASSQALRMLGPKGKIYEKVDPNFDEDGLDNFIEANEKKDIFDINRDLNDFIDGDITPNQDGRNTVRDTEYQWPSTSIPYEYASELSLEAIGSIELAKQEYKLRTCLDFVERGDQENYILFETLGGCYSSVGMVGGEQTISIGSGCERMATVCHEMMHAIGIWHEQSRADRDDYVKIEWGNIQEGKEHNFIKYDWEETDARRVSYDFNSVMHYGDTSFSDNGKPTIVTKDPAFQDAIGQRLTFSRGDSKKINRMYNCSDTLLYTYNCNYEEEEVCGYSQDTENDDVDWFRYVISEKTSPGPSTSPTLDGTFGISGYGSYMMLDTSAKQPGLLGQMQSMRMVSKSQEQCLQFSFYLDREPSSTAAISVNIGQIDQTTGDIVDLGDSLVTLDGDYGANWNVERIPIQAPSAYRLVVSAKTGGSADDVIAVDDISIQDKPCETAYFQVSNYTSILNSFTPGEYFYSPEMYTDEGYKFQLKVYPVGTTSSNDGYMSLYFGLVEGENDDTLAWPFCNKYVRMMVVDQNNNPLYAMNKYSEFLTSQDSGGDVWNQPTSSTKFYGYRNYMKLSDLTETHNYLKHDTLMVSVLVKDMNYVHGTVCSGEFTRDANLRFREDHEIEHDGEGEFGEVEIEGAHTGEDSLEEECKTGNCLNKEPSDAGGDDPSPSEAMISVGAAAGIAIGSAMGVFVIMSVILYCVDSSHKRNLAMVVLGDIPKSKVDATAPPAYESAAENPAYRQEEEKV